MGSTGEGLRQKAISGFMPTEKCNAKSAVSEVFSKSREQIFVSQVILVRTPPELAGSPIHPEGGVRPGIAARGNMATISAQPKKLATRESRPIFAVLAAGHREEVASVRRVISAGRRSAARSV